MNPDIYQGPLEDPSQRYYTAIEIIKNDPRYSYFNIRGILSAGPLKPAIVCPVHLVVDPKERTVYPTSDVFTNESVFHPEDSMFYFGRIFEKLPPELRRMEQKKWGRDVSRSDYLPLELSTLTQATRSGIPIAVALFGFGPKAKVNPGNMIFGLYQLPNIRVSKIIDQMSFPVESGHARIWGLQM